MKKILIAAAALMAVTFVAKAEYLFWQVTTEQYANAGANSSSLYASYQNQLYYLASTQTTSGQYDVSNWTGQSFNLSDTGVDYYVELASYNASETPSYTAQKNAGPFKYSDLRVIDDNMLAAMRQTIQDTWSGATYNAGAVPEPTSGLMVLVGMALLGLKRRRV